MISRRRLLVGTASAAMAGMCLRAGDVFAAPADFQSQIEALEQRAAKLGIVQPAARSLDEAGDEFTDAKDRLLDLMDAGEGLGPEGRALGEDAGEVLARITADESQTPKGAKDTDPELPAVRRKFDFDDAALRQEFRDRFASCVISEEKRPLVERDARRLLMVPRYPAYKEIESRTGVPWYFVAAIHNLEASLNMTRHLHNGDPLKFPTTHVPANRPDPWNPPNDWASSATDALRWDGFLSRRKPRGWSLEAMLFKFERYNGLGSRRHGIFTPYLWSYTNHYTKGKYVADGVWSDEAVSKQCGAVALLKVLIEKGAVETPKLYGAP